MGRRNLCDSMIWISSASGRAPGVKSPPLARLVLGYCFDPASDLWPRSNLIGKAKSSSISLPLRHDDCIGAFYHHVCHHVQRLGLVAPLGTDAPSSHAE